MTQQVQDRPQRLVTSQEAAAQEVPRSRRAAPPLERLIEIHGRTFALATRFLPQPQRRATIILYAFFRTLDDLVDERAPHSDTAAIALELDAWRVWVQSPHLAAPREPLGAAMAEILARYAIPAGYLLDFLEGMAQDLYERELQDFGELRRYSYQVASTVGLSMTYVLGSVTSQALAAAEDLGIAMQLTNILRDVGGDLSRGRVYLPRDELAGFGCSRSQLSALAHAGSRPDARFRRLMQFQIARAHSFYRRGMSGIWLLAPECRLPILLAARLYRKILQVIERNDYDVLRRRAATSLPDKLAEILIAMLLNRLWSSGERPYSDEGLDLLLDEATLCGTQPGR